MTKKKPTYFTPHNTLKDKVGEGGIPLHLITRCQEYLESNPVDLTPFATRHLDELTELKSKIDTKAIDNDTARAKIFNTIMQLKSNGSMFHYQLISMISDVMLRFMENVKTINADFTNILGMYNKILEIIIVKRLQGNGGREGYALTQELHASCSRYYNKYNIKP